MFFRLTGALAIDVLPAPVFPFTLEVLGIFVGAWVIFEAPNAFLSTSKMMLAGKLNLNQSAVYSEDSNNFYGTQIQLMQSAEVRHSSERL